MATINAQKELAQPTHRPILLGSFRFPDASVLRVSTIAVTFGGQPYLPYIEEQEIERLAVLSAQGVDRVPSVSMRMIDADAGLYTAWERAAGKGFKGATLTLTFAVYDPVAQDVSTDDFKPFTGICDKPASDSKYLTVSANSKTNLTLYSLPTALIQPNCMWVNPVTAEQRAEADDPSSRFYPCGETNNSATPCAYTKSTCTRPDRFSGLTWEPERSGAGREYITGNRAEWRNADTSEKYRSYVPLWLGGTCWIEAVVANQVADGNYTRGEAIVGMGAIDIDRVIVNGHELSFSRSGDFRWHYVNRGDRDGSPNTDRPYNGEGDGYPSQTAIQFLATKAIISPDSKASVRVLGRRRSLRVYRRVVSISGGVVTFDGANQDCAGNPPFSVTIEGNSGVSGTFTLTNWTFGPPGTITLNGTTGSGTGGWLYYDQTGVVANSKGGASTPWSIMEALRWARMSYSDLDVMSFADVAKIANADYSYTDQNGATSTQTRFSTAMALRERRRAAEVISGLKQSIGAMLVPGADGQLKLQLEGTLAEQQPVAVGGSNYNTAVSSKLRNGTAANGYAAYHFDFDAGLAWGLKRAPQPISESPNRVQFQFTDPAQGYALSTFSLVDPDDVARTDQETPGGLQVQPEGIASHNHALRCGKLGLAKIHRGNAAGDSRGTDWWEWQCSFRGCRLTVGCIVLLTNQRYSLDKQPVRITEIKPSKNFEEMTLKGHFHDDHWYLDSTGSAADPGYSSAQQLRRALPAPWAPNYEGPTATGNSTYDKPGSMFDETDKTFRVAQAYDLDAFGNPAVMIEATGFLPISNVSSLSLPLVSRQGTTATSGGTIPGASGVPGGARRLYVSISAEDSGGKRTPLSEPCWIDITATTNLNTATVGVISWDPDTSSWHAYAGWDVQGMTLAASGSGKPSSITLTALKTRGEAPPDPGAAKLRMRIAEAIHSGVCAALITAVGSNTITCNDLIDGTDDWNGRDLSILADATDGSAADVHYRATAYDKTTGQFTVAPNVVGVHVGDVLVVRAQATTSGADTITDSKWVNKFAATGMVSETNNRVLITHGKGRGQWRRISANTGTQLTVDPPWDDQPDSTSRFIVVAPDWQFSADAGVPVNSDPDAEITIRVPVNNWLKRTALVQVLTVDADGRDSSESLAPVRDIYLFGQTPGVRVIAADYTVVRDDRTILVDASAGPVEVTLLPGAQMLGMDLRVKLITNGSTDTPAGDDCTIVPALGEDIDGATSIVLDSKGQSL